jgi:hypothetical protein
LLLPELDLFAEAPFGQRQRGFALRFRLCFNEVRKAFGLSQVDPPVLESPPREFARLGLAQSIDRAKSRKHRVDHCAPAMTLKFNDIFAGRTPR